MSIKSIKGLCSLCALCLMVTLANAAPPENKVVKGKTKTATLTYKLDPQDRVAVVGAQKYRYVQPYQVTGDEWLENQWSWLTWWEANAHRYLKPAKNLTVAMEGNDQRNLAQTALLKILHESTDPKLLQVAAYSLGRMQSNEASNELIKLLDHPNSEVVRSAWLALGIVDDELARHAIKSALVKPEQDQERKSTRETITDADTCILRNGFILCPPALPDPSTNTAATESTLPVLHPKLTSKTVDAWIMAVGLSQQSEESLLKARAAFVTQNHALIEKSIGLTLNKKQSMPLTRLAMWAIRMHKPDGVRKLCWQVLENTTDVELFDEAIQTLATLPRERDLLFVHTPLYYDLPAEWNQFAKAIYKADLKHIELSSENLVNLQSSAAFAFDNPAIAQDARLTLLARRTLSRSYTWIHNTNSYKTVAEAKQLYRIDNWRNHGKPSSHNGLRFGIIALGNLGDAGLDSYDEPVDGPLLCQILRGDFTDRTVERCESTPWKIGAAEHDPSRGFAAIALGLYLRRMPPDNREIENDKLADLARQIERRLVETASDTAEPCHLRSACVLALGLSHTATAGQSIRNIQEPDPIMASYVALALGMLNDPMTFDVVKQAYEKQGDLPLVDELRVNAFKKDFHLKAILMQRNLIRALACMAEPQANPLLLPHFMENSYTSRDMIGALKWSGDTSITPMLVELMQEPGDRPELALFCAWALGELHDPNLVPVLTSMLLRNRNITIQASGINDKTLTTTQQLLQTVDPFLFKMIITGLRG